MQHDIKVERFTYDIMRGLKMPIVVIYYSPSDYPGIFIARLFDLEQGTRYIMQAELIQELRERLPAHLTRSPRTDEDPGAIVETWF
nr:MAG TPA_asm: hypothetical protein [Caudoviricetes sp.]